MSIPAKRLTNLIDDASQRIRGILDSQSQEVALNREDSRIARAIKWLLDAQRQSGCWGNDSVACTAVVCMAIHDLSRATGQWSLDMRVAAAFAKAEDFLVASYSAGRYENAIWDTAVAIRALLRIGPSQRDFIGGRVSWLLGLDMKSNYAGPHHHAQRVLALAEAGASKAKIFDGVAHLEVILETQAGDYSPYSLGQCLDAFRVANVDPPVFTLKQRLLGYLERTHLDSATFVGVCVALCSLRPYADQDTERRVRLSVASLFGESAFRSDGTWYHDEWSTAWALLALTAFSREIVVRAPKSELTWALREELQALRIEAEREVHLAKRTLTIVMGTSLLFGAGAALYVLYTTIPIGIQHASWIDWGVPGFLALLGSYLLRTVFAKPGERRRTRRVEHHHPGDD